jgi:hypothetical protein
LLTIIHFSDVDYIFKWRPSDVDYIFKWRPLRLFWRPHLNIQIHIDRISILGKQNVVHIYQNYILANIFFSSLANQANTPKKKQVEQGKQAGVQDRACGGYTLGYPHGYTWAAPSEVAWPIKSKRAPQAYKV